MKVAFVSGPYRADTIAGTVDNIRAAEAVAKELWRLGFAVFCPHLNTALFDGVCSGETWLAGDLEILSRCDLVVLVPDWERSAGATAENKHANSLVIPVYEWPADSEWLREIV